MKRNSVERFDTYYAYMESVRPRLIEAEKVIKEIKGSYEWKRAFNYFQTLYNRGQIKERPTKENGYRIERGGNVVQIADIESILTPEQLALVKKKAFTGRKETL